jgi:hypothetical protein
MDDTTRATINAFLAQCETLGQKSPTAAGFIARVPIVAVEIRIDWLRITNLTASPIYSEATFDTTQASQEQKV